MQFYNHLKGWCDVSAPMEDNLKAYEFITGCSKEGLCNASREVAKAFEVLPEDVKIISSEDEQWVPDITGVPFLYVRGDVSLLKRPSISVVGTRQPSAEGIEATKKTVDMLGSEYVIVSGLAKGIDGAAHIEALAKNFRTIAVLGTPINVYYPPEHEQLQEYIAKDNLVVSQFGPSRAVQQYFFMERNLTMSQISQGSVVVESSDAGGGVKQAQYSEKQGKPVFIFKNVYDNAQLDWPKRFESPVVVPSFEMLFECVRNPGNYTVNQQKLF